MFLNVFYSWLIAQVFHPSFIMVLLWLSMVGNSLMRVIFSYFCPFYDRCISSRACY